MNKHIRNETMRIAGERVDAGARIEVMNPYTNEVIGTVPKGTVDQIRRAFEIAASYKPSLSRSDRAVILQKAADILIARNAEISDLITAECGIAKRSDERRVGKECVRTCRFRRWPSH